MAAQFGQEMFAKFKVAAEEARSRAQITYKQVVEKVTKSVYEPLNTHFTLVMKVATETKESLTGFATSAYTSVNDQGVKAWAVETGKAATKTLCATAEFTRTRTLEIAASAQAEALSKVQQAKVNAQDAASKAQAKVVEVAAAARETTNVYATKAHAKGKEVAMDKSFQATAASAATGAVAFGSTGAVTGLATGTVVGAVVGFVPALFTFGLSIPIGAALGGGCGLVAGVAAGSTVGAACGGAAGYGVHNKKDQIADVASFSMHKVNDSAEYVKGQGKASLDFVKEKATVVRARLVGGGTGSTEDKN